MLPSLPVVWQEIILPEQLPAIAPTLALALITTFSIHTLRTIPSAPIEANKPQLVLELLFSVQFFILYCSEERPAPLTNLRDKKIGLVGLGNTGYTTARVAIGFGMQVYALTSKSHFQLPPEIKKMDLDQLFSECDIVSLHCPLTPETHELVNARRLAMMKPNAILINTGRGPLINEQDLADALNSGKIYAAGVDVLSTEPPRADNPLLTAKNCYITPHIAWATTEARERLMNMAISNLQAYIAGTPENVVNK